MLSVMFVMTQSAVTGAALVHTNRNKAEDACARSDLFKKRWALMDEWADFLAR